MAHNCYQLYDSSALPSSSKLSNEPNQLEEQNSNTKSGSTSADASTLATLGEIPHSPIGTSTIFISCLKCLISKTYSFYYITQKIKTLWLVLAQSKKQRIQKEQTATKRLGHGKGSGNWRPKEFFFLFVIISSVFALVITCVKSTLV